MSKVVCSGYLTKNPTSGGRGRWRLRWVELVDSRNKEGGYLRVEYSISEKKRKNPLGVVSLEACVGIRELRGGNSSRYTNAFSFLFTDRSDLILSSSSPNEVHRWMRSVKKCGIPILVSIAGVNTLTRSISEANVVDDDKVKNEVDWSRRKLPASPPPPFRYQDVPPSKLEVNTYAVVVDEDLYKPSGDHYYSRADWNDGLKKQEEEPSKRWSQPEEGKLDRRRPTLIVEPAPNLVALKAQLKSSHRIKVVTANRLKVSSHLVDGAFGAISEGTLDQVPVAVKELKPTCTEKEEIAFLREAFIISQFNHPNIVKVLGVVIAGRPTVVLELLSTSSLRDHLVTMYQRGKLGQEDLLRFSREVALGMRHMHTMGYIHKRLRAEHVLMSSIINGSCKIAGFCESSKEAELLCPCSDNVKLGPYSTEIWMAIEVLRKQQYSYQSDVWSYGVLLYEIWSIGRLPYHGLTFRKLLDLLSGFQCQPPPPGCPQSIYKIMIQCWYHKPSKRPTWLAILDALKSPDMNLAPGGKGPGKGPKLPPESLKLGAANLNSTKLLHKDLQMEYIEIQKQHLAEVLHKLNEEEEGKRDSQTALLPRVKNLYSSGFGTLKKMFSRGSSRRQEAKDSKVSSAPSPANEEEIVTEKNLAYESKRSSLPDAGIWTERNAAYGRRPQSMSLVEEGTDDLQSNLCDVLDLYESVDLGHNMGMEGGSFQTPPPRSLDPNALCRRTRSRRVPGHRPRSCESLAPYDSIDFTDVSERCPPNLHERRSKAMAKSKSLSDNAPVVGKATMMPVGSTPVGLLVRQFESLQPAADAGRNTSRPHSTFIPKPSSSSSSPSSSTFNSLSRNVSSPAVSAMQSLATEDCSADVRRTSDSFKSGQLQSGSSPADERSKSSLQPAGVRDIVESSKISRSRSLQRGDTSSDYAYEMDVRGARSLSLDDSPYEFVPTRGTLQSYLPATAFLPSPLQSSTTSPPQFSTTPPPQSSTTPPPQSSTTPPPQSSTTPPPQSSTTPPLQFSTTPPLQSSTTSPPQFSTTPPPQSSTTPPPQSSTTPPPKSSTTPPPQSSTTPPPQSSATPPPQSSATPPPQSSTTPLPKSSTTPPPQSSTSPSPQFSTTTPPPSSTTPPPQTDHTSSCSMIPSLDSSIHQSTEITPASDHTLSATTPTGPGTMSFPDTMSPQSSGTTPLLMHSSDVLPMTTPTATTPPLGTTSPHQSRSGTTPPRDPVNPLVTMPTATTPPIDHGVAATIPWTTSSLDHNYAASITTPSQITGTTPPLDHTSTAVPTY